MATEQVFRASGGCEYQESSRDFEQLGGDSSGRKVSWLKYQWTHGWVIQSDSCLATAFLTAGWSVIKFFGLILSTPVTIWLEKEITDETPKKEKGIGAVLPASYRTFEQSEPDSQFDTLQIKIVPSTGPRPGMDGTFHTVGRGNSESFGTPERSKQDHRSVGFSNSQIVHPASDTRTRSEIEGLRYQFLSPLGKGSQGEVHKVLGPDCRAYALKMISADKAVFDKAYVLSDERGEGLAVSFPKHENLMQTEGIFTYNKATGAYRFVTDRKSCSKNEVVIGLLLEHIPNSEELYDYAVRNGAGKKETVQNIGRQIAQGVVAMHKDGYLHRDLKLENVLIDNKGHIKIVDFGFARYLPKDSDRTKTMCGTPDYAAPELIEEGGYGRSIDAWSFGIILYALAFNSLPFHDDHVYRTLQQIVQFAHCDTLSDLLTRNQSTLSSSPLFYDSDFRNLLGNLLCHRNRRISMEEVLKHPFFAEKS
ncbi:MAG: serine/threonine-protein kinase [Simkania sp.]|nr:serine/threonine-protein kinase [Simkania sp.]